MTVPRDARERRVDLRTLPIEHDSDVAMDVNETALRDRWGDLSAEQLLRASAIERVDAMHDPRVGLREALSKHPSKEQVLGGARAAPLTQHALHRPVARSPVWKRPHRFDKIEKRSVLGTQRVVCSLPRKWREIFWRRESSQSQGALEAMALLDHAELDLRPSAYDQVVICRPAIDARKR